MSFTREGLETFAPFKPLLMIWMILWTVATTVHRTTTHKTQARTVRLDRSPVQGITEAEPKLNRSNSSPVWA